MCLPGHLIKIEFSILRRFSEVSISPENRRAYFALRILRFTRSCPYAIQGGRSEEARLLRKRILERDPFNVLVLVVVALADHTTGKLPEADPAPPGIPGTAPEGPATITEWW